MNPNDRRSFLIHITDSGSELAEKLNRALMALEDGINARVNSRDVGGFHAVMGAVEKITRVKLRER